MSHKIDTYTELKQLIHDDLRTQHPEWVKSNGDCPTCDSYESRLAQLLDSAGKSHQAAKNTSKYQERWCSMTNTNGLLRRAVAAPSVQIAVGGCL
jgi:hypothetical protein